MGGVSRNNNRDDIVGVFLREKVGPESSYFPAYTAYEDGTESSET